MSERKVLNKYYPPDFDPSKIPRRSRPKNAQQVVRLMAPFSMRCNTCGEYIYKGKKFNARKETVEGEDYYGIKIFRFYIKCTLCSAEITFKTDPKNTDYAAEHGASRNWEPWREVEVLEEEDRLAKLEEEENNPMKTLENKTMDSKREMDILDALADLRARNARHEKVAAGGAVIAPEDALDARIELERLEEEEKQREENEEDDAIVRQYFSKIPDPNAIASSSNGAGPSRVRKEEDLDDATEQADGGLDSVAEVPAEPKPQPTITIKRKADFEEPDVGAMLKAASQQAKPTAPPAPKKKKSELASALGIKPKKKVVKAS